MKTKLVNPNWEHQIKFNDGSTSLLVIENSDIFRNYITSLQLQANGEDGPFVLSDEKEIIAIKDRLSFALNPLYIEIVDKKVQTKITTLIKNYMLNEEHFESLSTVLSTIESFALKIEDDFPFELEHTEPEASTLIKMLGFSLKVDYQDEIEKLLEYTNVLHDICNIDHFVFVSLYDYFSEQTIVNFCKECNMNKHNILLIERHNQNPPKEAQKILIDSDLCEIF